LSTCVAKCGSVNSPHLTFYILHITYFFMDMLGKDPNVYGWIIGFVQKKHGNEVDSSFIEQEATRLYDSFGDFLVKQFEPMLSEEQKSQFDQIVSAGADQMKLQEFLMTSIPDITEKLMGAMDQFEQNYLAS